MGSPGWPEFAFWTASMARQRMVLIESWSSCAWSSADFRVVVVVPVGKIILRSGSTSECARQGREGVSTALQGFDAPDALDGAKFDYTTVARSADMPRDSQP